MQSVLTLNLKETGRTSRTPGAQQPCMAVGAVGVAGARSRDYHHFGDDGGETFGGHDFIDVVDLDAALAWPA